MDGWIDGLMVRWFDGSSDWRPCRRQIELERVGAWDREWGLRHFCWQVNIFWVIVDGLQYKCKRKCWFLFYYFLWNCLETAKSKALEIVYRAYARAVEGVVGEVKSDSWGGAQTKGEEHKRKLTLLYSDLLTSLSSSLTPLFFMIEKLAMQTNEIKR